MTAGGLVVAAPKTAPSFDPGAGEFRCALFVPPTGIRSTPATRRPLTSTTSTGIWCAGGTRSRSSRRAILRCPGEDTFDGVRIVRFPLELPADLTYGRVAQSRVSWLGRFARVAVMANYLEAQHRAILAEAREGRCRRHPRALGHPHRSRRGDGRPEARRSQRHHDARR